MLTVKIPCIFFWHLKFSQPSWFSCTSFPSSTFSPPGTVGKSFLVRQTSPDTCGHTQGNNPTGISIYSSSVWPWIFADDYRWRISKCLLDFLLLSTLDWLFVCGFLNRRHTVGLFLFFIFQISKLQKAHIPYIHRSLRWALRVDQLCFYYVIEWPV